MKVAPGVNIYSRSKDQLGVWLTNPTFLALKNGFTNRRFPIIYKGEEYEDVETAYFANRSTRKDQRLLIELIEIKLRTYPDLVQAIDDRGGLKWLESCRHKTWAKTPGMQWWEGQGLDSPAISCLYLAYFNVKEFP
jgi:hypothetical protein